MNFLNSDSEALPKKIIKKCSWLAFIFLLLVVFYQVRALHLNDRLFFLFKTHFHAEQWEEGSVWLPDYQVVIDARVVPEIDTNLSGLTYDPDLQLLWAVTNNPNELFALSRDGEVLGRYKLNGFQDVEAVAYAGDGLLIIGEERRQSLLMVPVPFDPEGQLIPADTLHYDQYPILTLALGERDNKGLEGLAFDIEGDRLFLARERDPKQLLEISGLRTTSLEPGFSLHFRDITELMEKRFFANDLSSVVFDKQSGHLLLLSDESRLIIEMTDQGKIVSFRSLSAGFAGLEKAIPQAEGLTIDDAGNIFIVSEPNLFYRFEPDHFPP